MMIRRIAKTTRRKTHKLGRCDEEPMMNVSSVQLRMDSAIKNESSLPAYRGEVFHTCGYSIRKRCRNGNWADIPNCEFESPVSMSTYSRT